MKASVGYQSIVVGVSASYLKAILRPEKSRVEGGHQKLGHLARESAWILPSLLRKGFQVYR